MGAPQRRKFQRPTRNLQFSGIQINSRMRRRRKLQRRNLWTLLPPRKCCLMMKCVKSTTTGTILWIPSPKGEVVVVIHFIEVVVDNPSTFLGATLSEEGLSSSSSTSTNDLRAFTQQIQTVYLVDCYYLLLIHTLPRKV